MNKKIIKFFACALVGIMTFSGCQKGNDKPQLEIGRASCRERV